MKDFHKVLSQLPDYAHLLKGIKEGRSPQLAVGLSTIHKAHFIYSLCTASGMRAHLLAPNERTAIKLCEDINVLYGFEAAQFYPAREYTYRAVEGASHEYEHTRLSVLGRIAADNCPIVVSSVEGAVQYTLPPVEQKSHTMTLKSGSSHDIAALTSYFVSSGYTHSEQVEGVGQFAVRGGIVDVFSPSAPQPYRIEFWGDEVDTIAAFDPVSQRRLQDVDAAYISPAHETLINPEQLEEKLSALRSGLRGKYGAKAKANIDADLEKLATGLMLPEADKYLPIIYDKPATLFDYCKGRLLIAVEPVSMRETLKNVSAQQQEDIKILMEDGILFRGCDTFTVDYTEVLSKFNIENTLILDSFTRSLPELSLETMVNIRAVQLSPWSGDYSLLKEDLQSYLGQGFGVVVCAGTERASAALLNDLIRDSLPAERVPDLPAALAGRVYLLDKTLSAGMEYPDIKLAIITHTKTAQQKPKKRRRHKEGKAFRSLSDLHPGDYVVHVSHGIGVFEGIVKRDMHGVVKDYLKLRYAGTDALFVPVTQLDLVSKYIGAAEGANVRLNKLNSVEWQKTRARVKGAVKEMAKELIALYAKRMNTPGHQFAGDNDWQAEFEERFPYDETEDQLRCVQEIKGDMQRPFPMDRLLCGDVGFGKTEVALRGIFKCVLEGKQCAVLVPTTILAWQHYQTFLRRLEGYPVKVELLSRFRTPKEQKETLNKLRRGECDVVIGTHRVVQKDVQFKDLGLCVIDEEQRFGVAHKEKFKEIRASVDVLTLSATPIPRTLNMAMSGIRDMSLIEEAPQDRHPVQTYVIEHDWGFVSQAIQKELRRGGQVFYLHNRIDSIDSCVAKLHELIPEARIVAAHGRVGEEMLSSVWRQLVEHEVDILVCTTIIETGVDVPNCNTLIIEDADRMGLSQLYQLRGRVGRSSRRAFAYFTFHKGKALSDIATKRLSAIREFTTFGSGFRIAMRDLEIRGAGNILGAQQHGHMEAVGYDLYLKLLSDAVSEEQGTEIKTQVECVIDIRLDAHIPERYIENLSQRIDIYKKIASVQNNEDVLDVTDELIDRFGDPPDAVKGLIDVALIRNTASGLGIREIQQRDGNMLLYPEHLDMASAALVASRMKGRIKLNAGTKPYLAVTVGKKDDPVEILRETLENMMV